ncbi:sialin isoform X1 [Schistocerca serialis cubense]|uniref:sialin isoform X1 n=1 Tax=Schistocerca serialis cubense TaxID=2023355 RepID=UPI00214DFB62|nr:sialin isoform X1 [Schistocerca serialis cubense]
MQDAKEAEMQRERLMKQPVAQMELSEHKYPIGGNLFGCSFFKARYLFAVLAAVSFAIIYGLKVNLSVCIVAMVNQTYIMQGVQHPNGSATSGHECPDDPDVHASSEGQIDEDGPFNWSETQQGLLLGAYFWGYMVSELPGGRMAEVYSARWVMFTAVAINVLGTVLTPPAAYFHFYCLVVLRVLEGLGGGLTFPAMHVMISHWAPPHDRAVLTAIIYAGTALGTVISFPLSGVIAGYLGWEWVFYIMGALASIWLVLWICLIKDTPEQQYFITEEERNMIMDTTGDRVHHSTRHVPWKAMFTSMPFYAILVCHFCGNVGWYMLLMQLPSYMKHILHFPIKKNAGLSALPYFCMWLFTLILGKSLEALEDKGVISQTGYRKIATSISSLGGGACLVAVTYVGCNKVAAVILMTFAVTFMGAMFDGYLGNHIDIAPHFAGTMMAITNTVATIPGITVPVLVGYLTEGHQTIARWRAIFYGTFGVNIFLFIFYMIFGTGVEQPWNKID